MKLVKLTSIKKDPEGQPIVVNIIFGPGIHFTKVTENKATAVSVVNGIVLVEETEEQIEALINKE